MIHGTYGGSGAKRVMACPASIKLSEGIPNTTSPAAATGSAIHKMLEDMNLVDDYSIAAQLGTKCKETALTITQDMIELTQAMWAADVALCQKYDYQEYEAETTGTRDAELGILSTIDKVITGFMPDGRPVLIGVDYKSGAGISVPAVGNEQLLHNFMSLRHNSEAMDMFEPGMVYLGVIIQPNRSQEIETKEWEFSAAHVDEFEKAYMARVDYAEQGGGQPSAGDHCKFCKAESICPAKTGAAHRALLRAPEDLELLSENMDLVEQLGPWIKAVEKSVFEALELGQPVDNYKLVQKLAREAWIDPEAAIKKLRLRAGGKKYIVDEKLKTPAQVRKVLAAKDIDIDFIETGLTQKKSSGTTIAKETDKREAVLSAKAFGAALASVS